MDPVVGVLALQGAFAAHAESLTRVGARTAEVRTPAHLEGVDALVMPGGESSTMSNLLASSGLFDPIAVRIANGTVYGLAAAVWSRDDARAQRVARRLRAGRVEVNGGPFNMLAPFGGYRQSGYGRELGRYGLEEFLEVKALQLAL